MMDNVILSKITNILIFLLQIKYKIKRQFHWKWSDEFWILLVITKDVNSHFEEHFAQCKGGISPVLILLLIFFDRVTNKGAIYKNLGRKIYTFIWIWIYCASQWEKIDKLYYLKIKVPV